MQLFWSAFAYWDQNEKLTCSIIRNQSLYACSVDDPSKVPHTRQFFLLQHLLDGILASQEDAFSIDSHRLVPFVFCSLVYAFDLHMSGLNGDASIVTDYIKPSKGFDACCHCVLYVFCFSDICFRENGTFFAVDSMELINSPFARDAVVVAKRERRKSIALQILPFDRLNSSAFPVSLLVLLRGDS